MSEWNSGILGSETEAVAKPQGRREKMLAKAWVPAPPVPSVAEDDVSEHAVDLFGDKGDQSGEASSADLVAPRSSAWRIPLSEQTDSEPERVHQPSASSASVPPNLKSKPRPLPKKTPKGSLAKPGKRPREDITPANPPKRPRASVSSRREDDELTSRSRSADTASPLPERAPPRLVQATIPLRDMASETGPAYRGDPSTGPTIHEAGPSIIADDPADPDQLTAGQLLAEAPDPADDYVHVSVFGGEWGKPSDDDEWCFLCRFAEDEAHGSGEVNPHMLTLKRMFNNPSNLSQIELAQKIQHMYNREFRKYADVDQAWTLLSIQKHMRERGSLSQEAQLRVLRDVHFGLICVLGDTGLKLQNKKSRAMHVCGKGVSSLRILTKAYLDLASRLES